MRVMRVGALIVGLMVLAYLAATYWFEEIEPRLCAEPERIVTTEQALAFGKQHIRNNEGFWLSIRQVRPGQARP